MDKLLTIVIPSYNVEKTLGQAVSSMLVPDTNIRNQLDILIVNDGSNDGTQEIAEKMASENPGIVRVWNKENGGHGSAINVGISQANGKYMKIVDGDDWLKTDALEEFMRILGETDADVVATDIYHYFMDTGKYEVVKSCQLPYGNQLRFSDVWDRYTFYMYSLAVKTELMRNQPHVIDEHCYYVDVEYDTLVGMVAETVLYVNLKLYVYRHSYDGQSVSVEGWMKHYLEHERVVFTLVNWHNELFADNPDRKDKISYVEKRIIRSAGGHYKVGIDFPKEARNRYIGHLKDYDAKLHEQGENIYRLAGKNIFAKWCRMTRFSKFAYGFLSLIKKAKLYIRKLFCKQ